MNETLPQMAYSVVSTEKTLDVGKTTVYRLINEGKLKAVKCGRRTLITRDSIMALLSQLPVIASHE